MGLGMTRRKKTRSIVVFGREWWSRSGSGNQQSASIYVNGEHVARLGPVGGFGDYYKQMAAEWLRENGFLPDTEPNKPLWHYRDDHGIQLIMECADITREGDL